VRERRENQMPWTSTPPTTPGFYWAVQQHAIYGITVTHEFDEPILVHVSQSSRGDLFVEYHGIEEGDFGTDNTAIRLWAGPIPVPTPPSSI
jgi:hypothetical protein